LKRTLSVFIYINMVTFMTINKRKVGKEGKVWRSRGIIKENESGYIFSSMFVWGS